MTRRFVILAGEPSGDRLGGALMHATHAIEAAEFTGVGGIDMQSEGLDSIFDMADLTVMGISEVVPRLPTILSRISTAANHVIAQRPDALITIDSPDFTLRVAAKARRALPHLKVIHYVAPSVWAWRPGRAKKMARHVDHVLALLPFEPPYMEAAGMSCDFVGHPVAARPVPTTHEIAAYRASIGLADGQPTLLLAPGSRRGEVRRLGDDFAETVRRMRQTIPDLAVLCPVAETVRDDVASLLDRVGNCTAIHAKAHSGDSNKTLAFAAADAALCASGTITLEIAAVGTPMVSAYRTTWLTAQIVRRVVRVKTANLINLVSETDAVPEYLQEFCTPEVLSRDLIALLTSHDAAAEQRRAFVQTMSALGRGGLDPAERAARSVLAHTG